MIITTTVNAEELALTIAHSSMSRDDLIRFIMIIDEAIAEMDFTVTLRDKLNEVIKIEGGE